MDKKISASDSNWAVSFGGAKIQFDTKAQAKRFIRDNQKDVADRRGGTFKAVIVRTASGKEAIL